MLSILIGILSASSAVVFSIQAEIGPLGEFKTFLKTLNRQDKTSILISREKFVLLFNQHQESAAEAFRFFKGFYSDVVGRQYEILQMGQFQTLLNRMALEVCRSQGHSGGIDPKITFPIEAFNKLHTEEAERIKSEYPKAFKEIMEQRQCGINFQWGEGVWHPEEDFSFLANEVLRAFNIPIKDYIEFLAQENRQRIAEDAHLLISWDALRRRITRWETWARMHAGMAEAMEARREADRLVTIFISGSRSLDGAGIDSHFLDKDLQGSYAKFLKANRTSSYYPLIEGFYRRLKSSGFHLTDQAVSFVEAQVAENPELSRLASSLRRRLERK